MAGVLALVLLGVVTSLPRQLGKAKASKSFRELFAKTRAINLMAAARIFLFGSRDVWFVVGLPVFLYGFGWKYMQVAGFVAVWTIAYGAVQALAPVDGDAQPRRAEPRGSGGPRLGRGSDRSYRLCWLLLLAAPGIGACRHRAGRRTAGIRLRLRGDLVRCIHI